MKIENKLPKRTGLNRNKRDPLKKTLPFVQYVLCTLESLHYKKLKNLIEGEI